MIYKNAYLKFIYNNEYNILNVTGVICGIIILLVANDFFVNSKMYPLVFIFGLLVGSFGFIIEYFIKVEKKKALDSEFSFFLYDLSKEFKKTNNLAIALSNILENNFYGNINSEIKKIVNRVSWGDSFENSLKAINNNINSPVITHTLVLLEVFNKSNVAFDVVLKNISNDIKIFKSEDRNKKYFSNLFYLSLVFYFVFVFVLLYINYIIGSNFLWLADASIITRLFFDNFMLYVSLLIGIFTAFVMYSINKDKSLNFVKYILIIFIITVASFQVFSPKPDAEKIILDTINYMEKNNLNLVEIEKTIALKTISSKFLSESTNINNIYFFTMENKECYLESCIEYTIFISDPSFLKLIIEKKEDQIYNVIYEKL